MNDLANPSGALEGDPRYGLSESELKLYYMNKSPCWFIHIELDIDKFIEIDDSKRRKHKEYFITQSDRIRFVGPIKEEDGINITGFLILLDAPDRGVATLWVENDPYFMNDVYKGFNITRWSSSMEMRQLDYPRMKGWEQFVIIAIDGPDGNTLRNSVAGGHHEYQALVMERYVARGPLQNDSGSELIGSLMIMEFPSLHACEEFWRKEPLNYVGVFKEVMLSRWAYGEEIE